MFNLIKTSTPTLQELTNALTPALSSTSLCKNLLHLIADYTVTHFQQQVRALDTRLQGRFLSYDRERIFLQLQADAFGICDLNTMKVQRFPLPEPLRWADVGSLMVQREHLFIASRGFNSFSHYTLTPQGTTCQAKFEIDPCLGSGTISVDHTGNYLYVSLSEHIIRYDLLNRHHILWPSGMTLPHSYQTLGNGKILYALQNSPFAHTFDPSNRKIVTEPLTMGNVTCTTPVDATCATSNYYVFSTKEPKLFLCSLVTGNVISLIDLNHFYLYQGTYLSSFGAQFVRYYYRDYNPIGIALDIHDLSSTTSSVVASYKAPDLSPYLIFSGNALHSIALNRENPKETIVSTFHFTQRPSQENQSSSYSSSDSNKRKLDSASPQGGNKKTKK